MARVHVRIRMRVPEDGAKHVVIDDEILVVPEEGEPIDISELVQGYMIESGAGEARRVNLALFAGLELIVEPPTPRAHTRSPGAAAPS